VGESARGKCRLVVDLAAYDPKRAGERDSVGVVVAFDRGPVHQMADDVMDQQEAVEFLFGTVGVLGAQDEVHTAEVGLDFVECGL
jgi:hypothetical protein